MRNRKKIVKQWIEDLDFVRGSNVDLMMERLEELVQYLYSDLSWNIVPSIKERIGDIQLTLAVLCTQLDLDIDECQDLAFANVKDCKGKMINGVYVEEEI